MKVFYTVITCFLLTLNSSYNDVQAQELEFDVTVNTPKLQTVDPRVFQDMESQLQSFLNNRKWTEDAFNQEERIKCNIQLTITEELGPTSFAADLAIQSARPVFNSSLETALLTHVDKGVTFRYEQFQPLEFSENNFNDNLTSILGFYVYLILGLDYDSFSPLGGEEYLQRAQNIINIIPSNVADGNPGWRPNDGNGNRNRYWILENLLSPRVKDLRYALYDYHLRGLDLMPKNQDLGRANILKAMQSIEKVGRAYPNSMIIQMFFNAKNNELVDIFNQGTRAEKTEIIRICSKLDPANAIKYRKIGS